MTFIYIFSKLFKYSLAYMNKSASWEHVNSFIGVSIFFVFESKLNEVKMVGGSWEMRKNKHLSTIWMCHAPVHMVGVQK